MEAEIDSTDRLVPNMTELFGEALLRRHFTHSETVSSSAQIYPLITLHPSTTLNNNNNTNLNSTVPGAVPPTTPISQQNGKKRQRKLPITTQHKPLTRTVRFVDYDNTIGNRTNSMMSHTTFVLDNDKRKPLLVPTGFQEGNSLKIAIHFTNDIFFLIFSYRNFFLLFER